MEPAAVLSTRTPLGAISNRASHFAPNGAQRFVEPPGAINISPLRGEATASEARHHAEEGRLPAPYHSRFTIYDLLL